MKETSIENLLDEYAGAYRVVDLCRKKEGTCKVCVADKERMQEIIKEITTKIEENVLREVMKLSENQEAEDGFGNYYPVITPGDIKSLAESRNIKL